MTVFKDYMASIGCLEPDGRAVSRVTFNDLFTAVRALNVSRCGASTFNLPSFSGEFYKAETTDK